MLKLLRLISLCFIAIKTHGIKIELNSLTQPGDQTLIYYVSRSEQETSVPIHDQSNYVIFYTLDEDSNSKLRTFRDVEIQVESDGTNFARVYLDIQDWFDRYHTDYKNLKIALKSTSVNGQFSEGDWIKLVSNTKAIQTGQGQVIAVDGAVASSPHAQPRQLSGSALTAASDPLQTRDPPAELLLIQQQRPSGC